MDTEAFLDDVRERKATELDRLGSDKRLLALTDATLETEAVLAALATDDATVREVFREWELDETDAEAKQAFAVAAGQAADHAERLAGDADVEARVDFDDPAIATLRSMDDAVGRAAAGLVARPLVRDRTLVQAVNFFVNEADEPRADLIRDLRTDLDAAREDGLATLAACCGGDADAERAREAAVAYVDAAYRGYVDALEALGLDPKPIC